MKHLTLAMVRNACKHFGCTLKRSVSTYEGFHSYDIYYGANYLGFFSTHHAVLCFGEGLVETSKAFHTYIYGEN